jgi:hypothetical protein
LLSPSQRSLRSRLGAFVLHSRYSSREITAPARAKFLERFLDEVDPDRTLPDEERHRRAEHARRAYFARLALKSARTRSRKKNAAGGTAAQMEARDAATPLQR